MKLGIFTKTFPRPTVAAVFDAVARHGLQSVQFNFGCAGLPSLPDEIALERLEQIRGCAQAAGISVSAVSGTFNMIHPTLSQRSDGLQRLRVVIAACTLLGANLVTLCSGTRDPENMWRHHPDNASPEAWSDLVSSLEQALEVAEAHDITLGIEPETNNIIDSARAARRLLDEMMSPHLKIVMDAANLFRRGELPRRHDILDAAFDLLGPEIVLAHAKELSSEGHAGGLPLGAGIVDWDHYLGLLRQSKFTGSLIMHGFEERSVPVSAEFLRGKLDAVH